MKTAHRGLPSQTWPLESRHNPFQRVKTSRFCAVSAQIRAAPILPCKLENSLRGGSGLAAVHSNTQKLIETWRAHRQGRAVPARTALSPIDLGPLLPQILMLGHEDGEEVFRLSGGLVADLYGRDLRGSVLGALWAKPERPLVADALARARRAAAPVVLTVDAEAPGGERIGVEICLAPLTGPDGAADRTIGLFQPISMVGRLMGQRIRTLSLRGAVVAVEDRPEPKLKLVALNGARVA
jgi:hypothetical protein